MRTPQNALSDIGSYNVLRAATAELAKSWKASLSNNELTKLEMFKEAPIVPEGRPSDPGFTERLQKFMREQEERKQLATSLMKAMVVDKHPQPIDISKAGVSSTLGYNFYDLRAPVRLLMPVNTHFRNTLPRVGRVNDGYGTKATWKATRNLGSIYGGVSEGNRNARSTPDENDYSAAYKEQGVERGVTMTAQFAGEGYADNLADEHIRGLFALQLQEEGMILHGNSGSTGDLSGYRLGTCATPTVALNATRTSATSTGNNATPGGADLPYTAILTTSNYVSVACVALTAMGNPRNNQYGYGVFPSIATGLTPSFTRNNVDGSRDTIAGGMSAISVLSAVTQITTGNLCLKASISPVKGALGGYAWFVDVETTNTGSLANAKFAGITTTPFAYINGTPTGTQTGTAIGLNADNSYNSLDFTGLLGYSAVTAGAGWVDMQGATLTSQKNGRVTELETALQYIFDQYQVTIDEIWGSSDAVECLDAAVRYSGTSAAGYQFVTTRDAQNNILGGFVVSAYQNRFAFATPTGAAAVPIRIHPMMPSGTLYLHLKSNPYQHSRAPYSAGMLVQRDYYSIEWPQVTREWSFGTYVHECLAHEMPWIPYVITGVGAFVGN